MISVDCESIVRFSRRRDCGSPALNPDFLYAAPDATAYAAFVKESRKKRTGATKLHRKSGEARDESRKGNRRSLHYAALRSG
jgi:hypothetical protein